MKKALIIALIVFLVGAAAYGVWTQVERVPVTRETGYTGEARRNPWLAAEWMFDRLGLPATSLERLEELPPTDHTLFLRSSGSDLTPARSRALLDWAEAGGNLILLAPTDRLDVPYERPDGVAYPITDALGFRYVRGVNPVDQTYDVGDRRLHALIDGPIRMRDERGDSTARAGRRSSAWLLSFRRGAGAVTIIVADDWMTSRRIDEADHARLAWELANGVDDRAAVWLVRDESRPGLLALIGRHWFVPVSALIALFVGLWRAGTRFGPILPNPERDRRDFSEHVAAAGAYLWRTGHGSTLLDAPRRDLRDRIAARRPDWAPLDDAALARELAAQMNWPEERGAQLLSARESRHAGRFARIVNDLKEARDAL